METPTQILTKPYPERIRRFIDNDIVPSTDKKLFYADLKKLSIDVEQVLAECSDVDDPDYGILADLADRINTLLNKEKNIKDMTITEAWEAVVWLRKEAQKQSVWARSVFAMITKDEMLFIVMWEGPRGEFKTPADAMEFLQTLTPEKINAAKIAELKAKIAELEGKA